MSYTVSVKNAVKRYGDFTAVNSINLEINQGEFFTLLGPSGCGKTTLLRMIAGFNTIDSGEIFFGDRCINNLEAHKRDIGMVFQNYAIFPHLSVEENVAYGLKAKKTSKNEIERRTAEALEQVQIGQLKTRRPNELSGGQQQRVALARAFVIEPGVLLMDEPLSNLDAKLRVQMRSVIKKLQRRLGITTIYVTHDQEEALAISDRIAVMQAGNIMQVGTPEQIYRKPENPFVASFIGVSNFIAGHSDVAGRIKLDNGYTVDIPMKKSFTGTVTLSARPEQLSFADEGIDGTISFSVFLGDFVEYEIELAGGQSLQLNEYTKDARGVRQNGEKVHIRFDRDAVSVYDANTGEVLSC